MDMFMAVWLIVLAALGWLGFEVYRRGRIWIPAEHVGIVHRIRFGTRPPDTRFRNVTPYPSVRGVRADVLLPNQPYWLTPGLYRVEKVPAVKIPNGQVGQVRAKEGAPRPMGQLLGRLVECRNFEDAQTFLEKGGQQGVQVRLLASDCTYYVNTYVFEVILLPRTYVPPGTIGLVIAKVGGIRQADQPFAKHVECNSFQDGETFLRGGGQQGRQLAILQGGSSYEINPAIFDVITVNTAKGAPDGLTADHLKEVSVDIGHAGVVVTLHGAEPEGLEIGPKIAGHQNFRLPWVFLAAGGRRGVQAETLSEGGVFALNPWFVRVMLIPTRLLYLDWTRKTSAEARGKYDADLDQIEVTIQGVRLELEMHQALRIPAAAAPTLVSQFGAAESFGLGGLVNDPAPVRRFVERVLGTTVSAYFTEIANASSIEEFLTRLTHTRADLATRVRQRLDAWGVESKSTTLEQVVSPDPEFHDAQKKEFFRQADAKEIRAKREYAELEDEIDQIKFKSEQRRVGMERRAELEAEVDALGQENYVRIRQIEELAKWKGPEYIGGNSTEFIDSMPMMLRRKILEDIQESQGRLEANGAATPGHTTHELDVREIQDAECEPDSPDSPA